MTTRNLITAVLTGAAALTASALHADTLTLNQNQYSYNNGGEFDAITSTGAFTANYSPLAVVNGGFETFCVEVNVDFNPGGTYYYTVGQTQVDPAGQNLTLGTAYLYYLFATGNLPGYDYNNLTSSRQPDAGLLQAAFWALQGGQVDAGNPDSSNPLVGNPYYSLALSTFGANATANSDGAFDVSILQMWNDSADTIPAQDQLVFGGTNFDRVPDGGSTALLLGGAFGALSFVGMRLRKQKA